MNDCISLNMKLNELPPNKRVQHVFGMVMGVDDFRQDQVHFEWKHRLSNMLLHGYGTVCGLAVTATPVAGERDVEIRIKPGYAISPGGHWIWVEREQCARLGAWLTNHVASLPPADASRRIYVTLCYDECYTDLAPIAASACAPEEATKAPSRVLESFKADFSWEPPQQLGEDSIRKFAQILSRVEITAEIESPPLDDSEQLLAAVRALGFADALESPPDSSPPDNSPPGTVDGPLLLLAAEACEILRRALNIWITEVCPRLRDDEDEACILVACIDFNDDGDGGFDPQSVVIRDCERPVLVSDRLKQELFCLIGRDGARDHSELDNLDADDHPQYLRTDGARVLTGDQSAGGNRITDLAEAAVAGDAVRFEQAIKRGDPARGDLGGTYPNPQVDGLNGNRVSASNPAPNQVLTWDGDQWIADDPPTPPPSPALDDLTDVEASDPDPGQVLTWNGENWTPDDPGQVSPDQGPHVLAPFGSYAIVAAGTFDGNGIQFPNSSVYGGLTVGQLGNEGRYRLQFPVYDVAGQRLTYIVKATIFDDSWQDFFNIGDDGLLEAQSGLIQRNELRYPGSIQVVGFDDEGILIWITQSGIDQNFIQRIARGERLGDGTFLALNFRPVSLPFMVEISAYGENLPDVLAELIEEPDEPTEPSEPIGPSGPVAPPFIDLNLATFEMLTGLPGIGPRSAAAIIAARPQAGFGNVDDLLAIPGIGPATVETIRPFVTVAR